MNTHYATHPEATPRSLAPAVRAIEHHLGTDTLQMPPTEVEPGQLATAGLAHEAQLHGPEQGEFDSLEEGEGVAGYAPPVVREGHVYKTAEDSRATEATARQEARPVGAQKSLELPKPDHVDQSLAALDRELAGGGLRRRFRRTR